jgi:hypothetical protein
VYWRFATLSLLTTAALFAQSNQGAITGTISDPAGAVVPTAQIEVRNNETGVIYRGGTSATGNFVLAMPSGTYEITVTAAGFKKFVEQNVQVISATDTRKDVILEVGSASEQVTVTETAPLLKTESGELSHLVTSKDVDELPVLTLGGGGASSIGGLGEIRNPLQSVQLLPGVTFSNDFAMVVNGLPSNSEAIRIEGQDATGNVWKMNQQFQQGASVDAIQEVAIQTSNFAAEYGQVGGGLFNITMKAGTNQFHGSGYDYFVNEALNAGLPFTDKGTQNPAKEGQHIRNPVRRNDWGFTLGGPIHIPKVYNGANRSFFFFNFEQYRENRTVSNSFQTVPTPAYQQGNFSTAGCFTYIAASNTCSSPAIVNTATSAPAVDPAGQTISYGEIFDPLTTRTVNGASVRSPFPNQQIPLTRFDPVAAAIQAFFPQPNLAGIINNYLAPAYQNWQHTTNWSFKLDHSVSPTKKLGWYFSRLEENSPGSNGVTQPYNAPQPTANRNVTTRVNYDQTLRPTLLLHVGVGFIQQYQPYDFPNFDEASLGVHGYFQTNRFPSIGGGFDGGSSTQTGGSGSMLNSVTGGYGGPAGGGVGPAFISFLWEQKSTANVNLTWVKGNHTFKYGVELLVDGFPEHSGWRANGAFGLSNAETADPWQNLQPFNLTNPSGFNYASFMLGLPDDIQISPNTQTKTGNHSIGLYAQDSWKITRKLTLDYGLRYDFQTYLKEEHGRMQDASFTTPNPVVGGLLGAVVYEGYGGGRCNCELSHNDPWAFGPRVGAAYQINPKTVLRAGAGITYGVVQTPNGLQYGLADYYVYNSLGYGIAPATGAFENNPFPTITWPNFSPGKQPILTAGLLPPSSPTHFFDPHAIPPKTTQWSFGIQRELSKDIVVEATYVGNRGVHWPAAQLDQDACNCLTDQILAHFGLSRNNPASLSVLTNLISSPQAIQAGFGPAYPGMPPNQTVNQQLRPVPQWNSVGVNLGPFIGKTWYDALQTKATKRFSHGLSAQASFVWAKSTDLGTAAENNAFVSYVPIVEDIYNFANIKQLNQLVRPLVVIVSGSYTTPGLEGDGKGMKALSQVVRGWQLGWLLRYQNGALIESAASTNLLESQLLRSGGTNLDNSVPGVNPLLVNPNCGCFNPQTTLVLNTAAWTNPGPGQWGASAPFTSNYRWQRQPAESMSFGRNFRVGKEGKYNLQVRAEFQNIFNRLFLSAPTTGSITTPPGYTNNATSNFSNVLSSGYGYIATIGGAGDQPRSGQLVGRFTF